MAKGAPPQTAAVYLAGWFAGVIAELVGFGLVGAGAGFLPAPTSVRYDLHPDGWPQRVVLDPVRAVVPPGHAWMAQPGITVVDRAEDVLQLAVDAVVAACRPIIDACRALAPVGRAGLWNEVGDGLGTVLSYQRLLPPDTDAVALLEAAVAVEGTPWRARPQIGIASSPVLGPVAVGQKGGCCLAYLQDHDDPGDDHDDEDLRVWRERFPEVPGRPTYCSTCSFRDPADCVDRQLFWLERRTATTPTDP